MKPANPLSVSLGYTTIQGASGSGRTSFVKALTQDLRENTEYLFHTVCFLHLAINSIIVDRNSNSV